MRIVVEDDGLIAKGLELTLTRLGHEVCEIARTGEAALLAVERHRPDALTCDVDLGRDGSGLDAAREAHGRRGIRTLFVAARVDEDLQTATLARAGGHDKVLREGGPFQPQRPSLAYIPAR